jgi:hypothetical protein
MILKPWHLLLLLLLLGLAMLVLSFNKEFRFKLYCIFHQHHHLLNSSLIPITSRPSYVLIHLPPLSLPLSVTPVVLAVQGTAALGCRQLLLQIPLLLQVLLLLLLPIPLLLQVLLLLAFVLLSYIGTDKDAASDRAETVQTNSYAASMSCKDIYMMERGPQPKCLKQQALGAVVTRVLIVTYLDPARDYAVVASMRCRNELPLVYFCVFL